MTKTIEELREEEQAALEAAWRAAGAEARVVNAESRKAWEAWEAAVKVDADAVEVEAARKVSYQAAVKAQEAWAKYRDARAEAEFEAWKAEMWEAKAREAKAREAEAWGAEAWEAEAPEKVWVAASDAREAARAKAASEVHVKEAAADAADAKAAEAKADAADAKAAEVARAAADAAWEAWEAEMWGAKAKADDN